MCDVELIGPYHGDSYGGHGTHTAAVGWSNLTIGAVCPGRAAPFRIDRNGTPIGWAPARSIAIPGIVWVEVEIIRRVRVGMRIRVKG